MDDKPLPDDFHEDLQWEIEADKAWDAYYLECGIDRSVMLRKYLDSFTPWWQRLWNWICEVNHER